MLLHQTVIGLELKTQLERAGVEPDVLVACVGGGSNFGGFAFPLLAEKLAGRREVRVVAVEPTAAPTLTKGRFEYDLGDQAGMAPLIPMYTLGADFIPAPIHAGGLRYHGDSALVSLLRKEDHIEAVAYPQSKIFEAAVQFARTEHPPRPRAGPRHPRRDRRGPALQGGGSRGDDRLQPLRPRPLRPQGLRGPPVGEPP